MTQATLCKIARRVGAVEGKLEHLKWKLITSSRWDLAVIASRLEEIQHDIKQLWEEVKNEVVD